MQKDRQSLDLIQQNVQRLSPRQVQFVRMLEMSGPEIEDEVQRQIDDNPALEKVETTDDVEQPRPEDVLDLNIDPDDDPADYRRQYSYADSDRSSWQIEDDNTDLNTYLSAQLSELRLPDLTRGLAQYIIGNIDENGYLTRSYGEMADDVSIATGMDITREKMVEAAKAVRSLDPPGVGAIDLRDCLLLQIDRIKPVTLTTRIARDVVAGNFDLFSKKHYDRLQAQLGVSADELRKALDLIKSLNPKPGSALAATQSTIRTAQITPDVMVEQGDDGRFTVSLMSRIPTLQIEKSFLADGDDVARSNNEKVNDNQRQARAFVKMKRDDAEAFIAALKQRSNTLLAVAEAIVKLQRDFFAGGDTSKLRPMILKDISALTGLDLSVVSRATAGKYMATPTGTYPMKMFFNESVSDDSDASSHKIQHEIQDVIDNEDKKHPLSDESIKAEMERRGYPIARRTVTKYREKMGIPVARLRVKY